MTAKAKRAPAAGETVELATGWPTDGPSNLQRPAPGAHDDQPATQDGASREAARRDVPLQRVRATPDGVGPAAAQSAVSVDRAVIRHVELGAFRRRRSTTAQVNHRVAPELKQALDRTAAVLGVPAVELLEALLAELDPECEQAVAAARAKVRAQLLFTLESSGGKL